MKQDEDRMDRVLRMVADAARARVSPCECPDPETVADWASGALREREQKGFLEHLLTCPECASVAADASEVLAPVRALHSGWLGWRGALLSALGCLAKDRLLSHAFSEHRTRCRSCDMKALRLGFFRRAALALFGQPYGPLRAAAIAAGVALVLFCLPLAQRQAGEGASPALPSPRIGGGGSEGNVVLDRRIHEKGAGQGEPTAPKMHPLPKPGPSRAVPPQTAEDRIRQYISRSSAEPEAAIRFWGDEYQRDPKNLVVLAALKQLYPVMAAKTKGEERKGWLDAEERVTRQLSALLRSSSGAAPLEGVRSQPHAFLSIRPGPRSRVGPAPPERAPQ